MNFTRKYSKQTLEECCKRALELNKVTYTFIKNSIPAIADEIGASGYNTKVNEERNKGGFIMDTEAMDINRLLSKSKNLAHGNGKKVEE